MNSGSPNKEFVMQVVITGAASGIGKSVAELLAKQDEPHRMLLTDRDRDGVEAVAEAIGPAASAFVADLSSPDCGKAIIAAAADERIVACATVEGVVT